MKKKRPGLYHAFVILPDRLYPFKTEVGGRWVRGIRSYSAAVARYQRKYGLGRYGYRLAAYRQIFHLAGSLLVIYTATFLTLDLAGSRAALAVLLIFATFLISYQEFFFQRRQYRQHWGKAITDWLFWCVPMGAYLFALLR
ncbi:hypothetical protein KGQ25_01310 [Patescibacteria group bacterium]|nr:hypothetical protein [Patescibacteria group bacterium]